MAEAGTVRCPACGHSNPAGMRFCGFCGQALTLTSETPAPPSRDAKPAEGIASPALAPPTGAVAAVAPVVSTPVVPVTPTAPVVPPPPPAKPSLPIPADPIAREVERDRLQTTAGVQRARGQITDARETLERVLLLSEGLPPREIAPVHEQIGDLLLVEENLEEAVAAFSRAHAIDPARVSAEKKFASTTLQIADQKAENKLSEAMLRGDSLIDLLQDSSRRGKRNAGMAMMLSMVPGFGQFYNGQLVKGIVILGIFVLSLLIVSIQPDRDELFRNFALTVNLKRTHGSLSTLTITMAIISVGAWLYSIVDAPFYAGKVSTESVTGPKVDKSGWEV